MKKISILSLSLISFIYLLLSTLFNFIVYQLIIKNHFPQRYFLIVIYFLGELFSFISFFMHKSKPNFLDVRVGPIINNEERITSISENKLSFTENTTYNYSTSVNLSETEISTTTEPFVGMKCISFLLPGLFDFLSKFLIFNGLFLLDSELILRSIIEIILALLIGKIVLKYSFDKLSIIGSFIIFLGLLISFIYYQIKKTIPGLYYSNSSTIGVVFCIFGEIFGMIQYLFQSKYFKTGEKYFFREVAWEGFFGFIISIILFLLSLVYTCPKSDENSNNKYSHRNVICSYSENPFSDLIEEINNNIIWNILFLLVSMFFSIFGVILIRYNSIIYRSAIDVCKIPFLSFIQIIIYYKGKSVVDFFICITFLFVVILGVIITTIIKIYKETDDPKIEINTQGNNLNEINVQNNL